MYYCVRTCIDSKDQRHMGVHTEDTLTHSHVHGPHFQLARVDGREAGCPCRVDDDNYKRETKRF